MTSIFSSLPAAVQLQQASIAAARQALDLSVDERESAALRDQILRLHALPRPLVTA